MNRTQRRTIAAATAVLAAFNFYLAGTMLATAADGEVTTTSTTVQVDVPAAAPVPSSSTLPDVALGTAMECTAAGCTER